MQMRDVRHLAVINRQRSLLFAFSIGVNVGAEDRTLIDSSIKSVTYLHRLTDHTSGDRARPHLPWLRTWRPARLEGRPASDVSTGPAPRSGRTVSLRMDAWTLAPQVADGTGLSLTA